MSVIEVSNLRKAYGDVQALAGVEFSIDRGEVIGLLGPNGAGKTTLMKILTGYLQPDEGTCRVANLDVADDPQGVQRHLGYLPESAPLYHEMAVQEYLELIAELREIDAPIRRRLLSRAVYATGLEDFLTRSIGTLSKGYRQRVGIAQAIIHEPEILILDEPTTGLDPSQIVEIRKLIRRLSEHSTVLLSTHILGEVEATCERALIVIRGELRADASIEELSGRENAVLLTIEEDARGVQETLAAVDGIRAVIDSGATGGFRQWRLESENSGMAAAVYEAIRHKPWRVSELRTERRSLESVFRELTSSGPESDVGEDHR